MGKKSAPAEKTAIKGGNKSDASHVLLPNGTKVRLALSSNMLSLRSCFGAAMLTVMCPMLPLLMQRAVYQVPVALPPGVNPETAKHVIEYLKQNPEAAQQSYLEAQRILHTPGMAESMLNSQTQAAADPAYQERLAAMQEDSDLKNVFDDIKANGAGAMEKYWNDSELMTKISEKMGGIRLQSNKGPKGSIPQKVLLSTLAVTTFAFDCCFSVHANCQKQASWRLKWAIRLWSKSSILSCSLCAAYVCVSDSEHVHQWAVLACCC